MSRIDNPHNVSLRQLSYLLALAEHGSISSAANALSIAQPSLSENIAKLEKSINAKLVIRGARGIQMTEAGLTLAERGREILKSIDEVLDEVRQKTGELRGPLSIGLPPSFGPFLSVPLVETICHEHPDIRLHIVEAMSGDILDWISSGRVNIGCVYEISDTSAYSFEPLLTEEIFLATAPDNWPGEIGADGFALTPVSAERLKELPMVLTSSLHGGRRLQERFARSSHLHLNVVAEIDSLAQIVEMVTRASAYTMIAHGAVLRQLAEGKLALVPVEEPVIKRTSYIVRSRTRPVSCASAMVEFAIRQIASEMVDRYHLRARVEPHSLSQPVGRNKG
ncbi:HTH-type transcriptional regulator EstR (plasmid) [Sphingobium sp. EP60837]|nr:HTH-type transcriptional regulator EstR [Sphingobium sp. EP60837]